MHTDVFFSRGDSTIETITASGQKQKILVRIDMINFKLFALLMCKGSIRRKAENLFELAAGQINGQTGITGDEVIAFNSGRLTRAFKQIVFFSEIFPKKYHNEFVVNPSATSSQVKAKTFRTPLPSKMNKAQNRSKFMLCGQDRTSTPLDRSNDRETPPYGTPLKGRGITIAATPPRQSNRSVNPPPTPVLDDQAYWSDEYLILAEENFDDIFQELYESEIIDQIFDEKESMINKSDFVTAIAATINQEARADWIFSP